MLRAKETKQDKAINELLEIGSTSGQIEDYFLFNISTIKNKQKQYRRFIPKFEAQSSIAIAFEALGDQRSANYLFTLKHMHGDDNICYIYKTLPIDVRKVHFLQTAKKLTKNESKVDLILSALPEGSKMNAFFDLLEMECKKPQTSLAVTVENFMNIIDLQLMDLKSSFAEYDDISSLNRHDVIFARIRNRVRPRTASRAKEIEEQAETGAETLTA